MVNEIQERKKLVLGKRVEKDNFRKEEKKWIKGEEKERRRKRMREEKNRWRNTIRKKGEEKMINKEKEKSML